MSLQDTLKEAQFVHCNTQEEFWALQDRLEQNGQERRDGTCQPCKYSELTYDEKHPLACNKFNIYVSRYDSCKYTHNQVYEDLILRDAEYRTYGKATTPLQRGADSPSSSTKCYVATAVYGTYDCPEVWTLRRFRDNVLAKTWYGRLFIHCYYAVSPTVVKLFGNRRWFQRLFRRKLDKMVSNLQSDGFESTPYEDMDW